MKRGEIWLVSLDPTSGHEQKGRRSVLIVSPEAFNRITRVPVVLPITSGGNFARTAGFAVPLTGAGTKTTGAVRCDQPRALDLAARGGRKLENIPDVVMDEVLARTASCRRRTLSAWRWSQRTRAKGWAAGRPKIARFNRSFIRFLIDRNNMDLVEAAG